MTDYVTDLDGVDSRELIREWLDAMIDADFARRMEAWAKKQADEALAKPR